MPHINRIRLVNVNYNDAKSIYDDFNMRLDGKYKTYDLISTSKYIFKKRKAYKKYIYRWKHKKNITLSCRMGT